MDALNAKAKKLSADFVAKETEYMLGFVEAEQSNPITRTMPKTRRRGFAP